MSWFNPLSWGFFVNRRKNKELNALEHLRTALTAEQSRVKGIIELAGTIESEIEKGNFPAAEQLIPKLARDMRDKRLLNQLETIDWKQFKRTIFKDLKSQLEDVK